MCTIEITMGLVIFLNFKYVAIRFLGVYSLGADASITCGGDSSLVRWERANGLVVSNSSQLATLVSDNLHHRTFYCRIYNASNLLLENELVFMFIVNGKYSHSNSIHFAW